MFWLVLAGTAALMLGSCFSPDSIECGTGAVCPSNMKCAANQAVCVTVAADGSACGDGVVSGSEVCDDGNIKNNDGCRSDCLSDETCGNGVLDPEMGEVCDDGNTDDTDNCSADCKSKNVCGNGIVDYNEACDDGLACTDGTPCLTAADCTGIGDGTCSQRNGDGCDNNCTVTACGNGIVTTGEVCDDGKNCTDGTACTADADCAGIGDGTCAPRDGDGCDADCTVTGCGNGVVSGSEVCDDGKQCQNGVQCKSDGDCAGIGDQVCITRNRDGCSADCLSDESCGNKIVDTAAGEVCDDGKQCSDGTECTNDTECTGIGDELCEPRDGDGCSATCRSNETCGNGIIDSAVNEVCDNGKNCQDGTKCTAAADCINVPGDGLCQARSGDGCSADCLSDETCGNGITDTAVGETCDDGKNCADLTPCTSNADCVGNTGGDEFCLPRTLGGNNCRNDCKGGAKCGNKLPDPGEQCDDGNNVDTDDCISCVLNVCGDGVVDSGGPNNFEECDDGGQTSTCDVDCTLAKCGDGLVNPLHNGEQCDNLATCADGSACTSDADCVGKTPDELCKSRDSATCNYDCTIAVCGDGYKNTLHGEACDDGGASATCNYDCTISQCPDGKVNPAAGEQCDDNGETSACNSDCTIAICGDKKVNSSAGEDCDDGGNSATCDADCTSVSCGDGFVNPSANEQCDSPTCQDGSSCTTDSDCTTGDHTCKARDTATCDSDCTLSQCGDLHVNTAAGEDCDPGTETQSCNANCTFSVCGDGIVNATDGEQCDAGSGGVPLETMSCDDDCTIAFCGDSKVNTTAGEDCDDGGESSTCNANCTTATCGDGIRNSTAGEVCDDGKQCEDGTDCTNDASVCASIGTGTCAARDGDGCSADCHSTEGCGNNIIDPGEVCDDGNNINGDGCSADCQSDETCGNGVTDTVTGEACDLGKHCSDLSGGTSGNADGTCNVDADCSGVSGDHKCKTRDDSAQGCDHSCHRMGQCGDGNTQTLFEQCDDGDTNDNNDCTNACTDPVCGDGSTWDQGSGTEQCDEGKYCSDLTTSCTIANDCKNIGDGTCATRDVNGCSATCDLLCGNGTIDSGETCDDGNNSTCGTCPSSTCMASTLTATAATGSIAATADVNDSLDGKTVVLDDGYNAAITFTLYDSTGSCSGSTTNICVGFTKNDTAQTISNLLTTEINNVASSLLITADNGSSMNTTITLANDRLSNLGNQAIGGTAAFTETGMSGGVAGDCSTNTPCNSGDDCASNSCTAGVCD